MWGRANVTQLFFSSRELCGAFEKEGVAPPVRFRLRGGKAIAVTHAGHQAATPAIEGSAGRRRTDA